MKNKATFENDNWATKKKDINEQEKKHTQVTISKKGSASIRYPVREKMEKKQNINLGTSIAMAHTTGLVDDRIRIMHKNSHRQRRGNAQGHVYISMELRLR